MSNVCHTIGFQGAPLQATGTCDLHHCWVSSWTSSSSVWCYKAASKFGMNLGFYSSQSWYEHPARLSSKQVSEFGVRTQLDLHRSAVSTLILRAVYCCLSALTELPRSALLDWLKEKQSTGFPWSSKTVQPCTQANEQPRSEVKDRQVAS